MLKQINMKTLQSKDVWHILPENDLYEHEDSAECQCLPRSTVEGDEVIVVHNAFDSREFRLEGKLFN